MHVDQKYILYLKNNDSSGIDEIYKLFASRVVGMILKNSGSQEEAYDILQESLIDIYHMSIEKNFVLTTSFSNFLLLVCRRKWINVLKKKKSRQVTNIDDSLYIIEDTANQEYNELLVQMEKENIMMTLLEEMGRSCREIIKRCMKKNVNQEEVAKALGLSYAYLRKKKSQCMRTLASKIQEHPYFNNHE